MQSFPCFVCQDKMLTFADPGSIWCYAGNVMATNDTCTFGDMDNFFGGAIFFNISFLSIWRSVSEARILFCSMSNMLEIKSTNMVCKS